MATPATDAPVTRVATLVKLLKFSPFLRIPGLADPRLPLQALANSAHFLEPPNLVDASVDPTLKATGDVPTVAIYAMSLAPYELHLYKRIANELPIRLQVLVARRDSSRDWHLNEVGKVQLEDLSGGDRDRPLTSVAAQLREWRRGGEVIQRLKASGAQAVVVAGYNDIGRLRVAWWCKRHGYPVSTRSDSNLTDEQNKSPLKRFIKRQFLRLVRRLTTETLVVGPRGIAYWRHYDEPAERLFIVPYEPDYSLVESISQQDVAAAKAQWDLDPQRRQLVFSGRLTSIKRVDLLIDAFTALAEQRPEWDLLILGDGEQRAELEARVPSKLQSRVTWVGFVADQRDMARLYCASDALVLPSDYEPWALVVNEAAAAGLAIVVSDVVGAGSALVRSGVNGEIFPAGDLPALTEALLKVTNTQAIEGYRVASLGVLADWRRDHDPVEGLRTVLVRSGVIPARAESSDQTAVETQ